jgi:hypothetical protein
MVQRDSQQGGDHDVDAAAVVQRVLELGVRGFEPFRVEAELAPFGENRSQEHPQRSVGSLARIARDVRLAALTQVVVNALEPR